MRLPLEALLATLVCKYCSVSSSNSQRFSPLILECLEGLIKTFHAYTAENCVLILLHDLGASHHQAEMSVAVNILWGPRKESRRRQPLLVRGIQETCFCISLASYLLIGQDQTYAEYVSLLLKYQQFIVIRCSMACWRCRLILFSKCILIICCKILQIENMILNCNVFLLPVPSNLE